MYAALQSAQILMQDKEKTCRWQVNMHIADIMPVSSLTQWVSTDAADHDVLCSKQFVPCTMYQAVLHDRELHCWV